MHDKPDQLDLSEPGRIHIVGVGGAGMSAIAEVLVGMGAQVSGSDLKPSANLERLRGLGVDVAVGHSADNVRGADAVAVSTAVPATNAEVRAATELGIPVWSRARVLAAIAATRRTIAVAGTHGKTTVSSMLALLLAGAGRHPSFIIGGEVNEIGTGAAWDQGDLLVVEADESDGTFLELPAFAAVVTNVEPDHLDHYGGFDAVVDAFDRFLAAVEGPRVVCGDDAVAGSLAAARNAVTYGRGDGVDYRMVGLETGRAGSRYGVEHRGASLVDVELSVPGAHNALNALAALVVAVEVGVDAQVAADVLRRYGGVARRFQFRGEHGGVTYVDDYAHLPTEVRAALATAVDGGWERVVCVFQPHRYSRTEALAAQFADAFEDADVLVVTDVYGAGEPPRPGISGKLVLDAVLDVHPWRRAAYVPRRPELAGYVRSVLRPGDVCLTLGAGDLTSLPDELLAGDASGA
jgi:UDP-N-acetylmuramate--alanine ligase